MSELPIRANNKDYDKGLSSRHLVLFYLTYYKYFRILHIMECLLKSVR